MYHINTEDFWSILNLFVYIIQSSRSLDYITLTFTCIASFVSLVSCLLSSHLNLPLIGFLGPKADIFLCACLQGTCCSAAWSERTQV